MKRLILIKAMLVMLLVMAVSTARANIVDFDPDENYSRFLKYDRYLDVEIWTNDEEYFEGDDIQISFKVSNDCFVAVYNIDTRGRVHLLFPADESDDYFIEGDRVYSIPGRYDEYDLTVQGPSGIEHLHIVASKKPFSIPYWFEGSGLETDYDSYDFAEFIDANYFGGENGLRRAFDMTSFYVEEWNEHYFRPVYVDNYYPQYYNPYWDWGYYGSVYIDYPFGSTIYIDGVYWGIAPLFIPNVYYGWHYFTVYDNYGYAWEDRIEVIRTKSIALNESRIKTRANVKSRFKDVQTKGYLNPAKNGYPKYKQQVIAKKKHKPISKTAPLLKNNVVDDSKYRQKRSSAYSSSSKKGTDFKRGSYTSSKRTSKSSAGMKSGKRSTSTTHSAKNSGKYDSKRTGKKSDTFKSHKSSKGSQYKSNKKSGKSTGSSTYKGSGSSKKSSKSSRKSGGKSSISNKSSKRSSGSASSMKGSSSRTTSSRSAPTRSSSGSGGSGKRRK